MADLNNTAPPGPPESLSEADLELVLLLIDGELREAPERLAQAEALLASSPTARAIAQDWTDAKHALREAIVEAPVRADLGLVRGRVMVRLPEDASTRRAPSLTEEHSVFAWLRRLSFGKVSFAVGLAAAAAVWLAVSSAPRVADEGVPHPDKAVAVAHPAADTGEQAEPSVIIEDMEIESGTVMVRPADEQGGATIIWHFQSEEQGAG